jgi:hypothetical protein
VVLRWLGAHDEDIARSSLARLLRVWKGCEQYTTRRNDLGRLIHIHEALKCERDIHEASEPAEVLEDASYSNAIKSTFFRREGTLGRGMPTLITKVFTMIAVTSLRLHDILAMAETLLITV